MSAPQKIDVSTLTQHSVTIQLGESDERIKPDFKKGLFRPTNLSLRWNWNHTTQGWRLSGATVTGPMVKKDGGDSENRGNRRLLAYGSEGRLFDGTPDWVRYLADEQAPTVVGR